MQSQNEIVKAKGANLWLLMSFMALYIFLLDFSYVLLALRLLAISGACQPDAPSKMLAAYKRLISADHVGGRGRNRSDASLDNAGNGGRRDGGAEEDDDGSRQVLTTVLQMAERGGLLQSRGGGADGEGGGGGGGGFSRSWIIGGSLPGGEGQTARDPVGTMLRHLLDDRQQPTQEQNSATASAEGRQEEGAMRTEEEEDSRDPEQQPTIPAPASPNSRRRREASMGSAERSTTSQQVDRAAHSSSAAGHSGERTRAAFRLGLALHILRNLLVMNLPSLVYHATATVPIEPTTFLPVLDMQGTCGPVGGVFEGNCRGHLLFTDIFLLLLQLFRMLPMHSTDATTRGAWQ